MATIALAAKRYDGGTGIAVFSGTVPCAPGVLFDSQLATITLFDGSTEVGVTTTALYPRHLDGSLKAIKIDATLAVNTGSTLALTLVTGTTPTRGGPGYTAITGAWMRSPRLIACTDATYLCSSGISPWPLTPVTTASLPDSWKAFLTTQFDGTSATWPCYGNMRSLVNADASARAYNESGGATYDVLAACYQRYLISGDIDTLADAHHLAQFNGGQPPGSTGSSQYGYGWGMADYTYGSGAVIYSSAWAGDAWYPAADASAAWPSNWEGYTARAAPLGANEVYSGFHYDCWFCYCLSGWLEALGTVVPYGLRPLIGQFNPGPQDWGFPNTAVTIQEQTSPNYCADTYGGRFTFQLMDEPALVFALCDLPMSVTYLPARTVPTLRTAANKQKYLQYLQHRLYENWDHWAARYDPSHYLRDIWGFCPVGNGGAGIYAANGNSNGGFQLGGPWHPYPVFDLFMWLKLALVAHLRVIADDRVPGQIQKMAALVLGMTRAYPGTAPLATGLYTLPYFVSNPAWVTEWGINPDPANVPDSATASYYQASSFSGVTMQLGLLAYGYASTGQAGYLTIIDAHARNSSWVYDNPVGAAGIGWKSLGEVYNLAFMAAYYRAGGQEGIDQGTGTAITIPTIYETDVPITITPVGGTVADFIFNIAKGRWAELYNRVKLGDPANAALVLVVLRQSGLESDDTLKDRATLAAVLGSTTTEVTNSGYARKVLVAADLSSLAPDNTADRMYNSIGNQTWSSVGAGDAWAKLLICYDSDTTSGTDSSIVPMHCFDFIKTPDGTDITAQIAAGGYAYAA